MKSIQLFHGALNRPAWHIRRSGSSGSRATRSKKGWRSMTWTASVRPEKTLADCFKYRNKIGLDVALEALKLYRQRKRFKANTLVHFARICRVERIMHPYLEATL